MKRLILITSAITLFFSSSLMAQETPAAGSPPSMYPILEKKLQSSDKNLENPKKNIKAKFWTQRADLLMDIYEVNIQYVFKGSDQMNIKLLFGNAKEIKTFTKDGVQYETHVYEKIDITYVNGVVDSYEEKNKIHEDPLPVAHEALKKAEELDVEKKEGKNINEKYTRLKSLLDRDGIEKFSADNYEGSLKNFAAIAEINKSPLMEGVIDTVIYYNAGMAASKAGMVEESIEWYELARKYEYPDPVLYVFLEQKYFAIGDTAKAIEVLGEGFDKYPENQSIQVELINYYLANDRSEEALNYLKIAQENDPTNLSFKFAEGNLYDKMGETEKARAIYQNCLDIDADYFNALYNMGISYYNESLKMLEAAEDIPANEIQQYNNAVAEAEKELAKGLPYMEKAHEQMPDDMSVVDVLKSFYYRLEMNDDFEKMKALLDGAPAE